MDLIELNSELEALSEKDLLSLPVVQQWVQQNVKEIELDAMPPEFKEQMFLTMRLQIIRRGASEWGVVDRLGNILHKDGRWFEWPMPTEDVPGTRFTLAEAVAAARKELPNLRHVGMDSRELTQWARKRKEELGIKD